MLVVISHASELAACLVAAAILERFSYSIKIVVVVKRTPGSRLGIRGPGMPWCGLSTVSNPRIPHWGFLRQAVLWKYLRSSLVFLESIVPVKSGVSEPDLPHTAQRLTLRVALSDGRHDCGLFYHPFILLESLKRHFLSTGNVSLASVQLEQDLHAMVAGLSEKPLWIDFQTPTQGNLDFDLLVHSLLSAVHYLQNPPPFSPSSVLWLPRLKAAAGQHGLLQTCILESAGSVRRLAVTDTSSWSNLNYDYDLFFAFRSCGMVLDAVGNMFPAPSKL